MLLFSHPISKLHGDICLPGDKSISHRAIILSAIAEGSWILEGLSSGEDCLATIAAFRQMGVPIEVTESGTLLIHGVGKYGLKKPEHPLDCGNSGTTMRLLAGLLCAQPFDTLLTGDKSLQNRPMARIHRPLTQMGAVIETAPGSTAPLVIRGGQRLRGINYPLPIASAQVKSCLLLASLYADGESQIIESCLTRDHTENMFPAFGFELEQKTLENNAHALRIQGCSPEKAAILANKENFHNSKNHAHQKESILKIPGDFSSAAFFVVAAMLIPHSSIVLRQVGVNPTRTGLLQILKMMGADIQMHNACKFGKEPVADLVVTYSPLWGISVPKHLIPLTIDELPILCVAAAFAEGLTEIRGAEELRYKESDRIESMIIALKTLGIEATAFHDGLSIKGLGLNQRLKGGVILDSFDDHRIAMSLAIAGIKADSPLSIQNCDSIATSFPNFIETANQVGLNIQKKDMP